MILILDEPWTEDTTSPYLVNSKMTAHDLHIGRYHAKITVDHTHRVLWRVTIDYESDSDYTGETIANSDGWTTDSVDGAKLRCEATIREHYSATVAERDKA